MSKLREALLYAAELICDAIEENGAGDWVDQSSSPLGRKKHLALARAGTLKATREGRRVLVRRADIDAYLEKRRGVTVEPEGDLERDVAKILSLVGTGRRRSA